MLITQLKAKETITSLTAGKKVFIINCHGCKEVRFPEKEAVELQKELSAEGNVTGIMTTDYICNPENMQLRLQKHMDKIREADLVLVFSCGVGVQTIAEYLEDKMTRVLAILPMISEKKGILHAENVNDNSKNITLEQEQDESQTSAENWTGGYDEEGNYTGEGEYDENGNIRLDENGEPVEISKGGFSYGDGPMIEVYAMTQEQMLACSHGDIRHGFVLEFNEHQPDIDIPTLEARVNELIRQDLPIDYYDESHILLGGAQHYCTGPRTHVRSTGRIIGFRLLDHFIYDHFHKTYMLVGCVGDDSEENIRKLETIHG